jgi:hypothetical protein
MEDRIKEIDEKINQLTIQRDKLQEEANSIILNNAQNTLKDSYVYVAYWVDLESDCLKESEIKILGVYFEETDAEEACKRYDHEGYADDEH